MSKKNKPLTEQQFAAHTLDRRILQQIDHLLRQDGLTPDKINLLDWGCGRGQDVLWLKEQGYNVFGIDVDPVPVNNGRKLFHEKGYDSDLIRVVPLDGTTDFPDNFFHLIFSNQVFEHVKDLESVAREMGRITSGNGIGFHIYPPHRHVVEKHLHMPFIHWLPKNGLRRFLISMFVKMSVEPEWEELNESTSEKKAETYYRYSIDKTYYRKPPEVLRIFSRHSFNATYDIASHPTVLKHPILGHFASNRLTRPIVTRFLTTFIRVELKLEKQTRT